MFKNGIKIILCVLYILLAINNSHSAAGDVWTETLSSDGNQTFTVSVYTSTGSQKLGTYQFAITFDQSLAEVDTSQGTNGVQAGADGFVASVNTDNSNGKILVNGFDISGKGPGSNLKVLIIHFKNYENVISDHINIKVENLTDETGMVIRGGI